ncbi:hypothetical protein ACFPT7_07760 [Acidicapsa dinghuensis]|uniref:Uncharacterized protein n=1 Tax=Acidicapsa dinghuensis TaxID=2218256 RepID=A0ABW1EDY6_9BACT|nr:hypothetical protein [Acidicapsa dinghuensis]
MNYSKPTVLALSSASAAIQQVGHKGSADPDTDTKASNPQSTGGSYDLDE